VVQAVALEERRVGTIAYNRIRQTCRDEAIKAKAEKRRAPDTEFMLRRFAMERFMVRINHSKYANEWCLKGGMLMLALGSFRTTEDLDLSGIGLDPGMDNLKERFQEICQIPSPEPDGLSFSLDAESCEQMRETKFNPTCRLKVNASLHTTSGIVPLRLKFDLSYGGTIRPQITRLRLPPSCKGWESPEILCYPWEQVVAEKIAAILDKGFANTRLRDFYDLVIISRKQSFDMSSLSHTVIECLKEYQHTPHPDPDGLSTEFANYKAVDWKRMVSKPGYCMMTDEFPVVVKEVKDFIQPILIIASGLEHTANIWTPNTQWKNT
jgi:Nucleotidyl transferase AbiEii toxin, Type IV TA system